MKHFILAGLLLLFTYTIQAQTISGLVENYDTNEPVVGALIVIQGTTIGTFSKADGSFELNTEDAEFPLTLSVSFLGLEEQLVTVTNDKDVVTVSMFENATIEGVTIESKTKSTDIDFLSAQHTELLNNAELQKAACCNLSESFENNATVNVSFTDAVTGSKQISMLGLDGVYAQINWENMPLVRGLGEYYGLGFVPGTWIESISVGKGAGSVTNGFESMTGQINLQLRQPDAGDTFYVNGYQNLQGRTELNSHYLKQINKNLSTGILAHGNIVQGEVDDNDDGFIDRNKGGQMNIMNRWKYASDGNYRAQFGVKYLYDEKVGGQTEFEKDGEISPSSLYGVDVESERVEVFTKNGFIFPEKPWKSLGLIVNANSHRQDARFGLNHLDAKQQSLYSSFIYQTILGNTMHTLKTGANLQVDDFDETLNQSSTNRNYIVPGLYAEYDYDNLKNLTLVAGIRGDYLNRNESFQVSPRIHAKFITDGDNSIRASVGKGFRVPNLYADTPTLLVNSRTVEVEEIPEIESSWNMGASITRYFKFNGREGTFSTDFYRTTFENQLIRDMYSDASKTIISNLDGDSYANSFQANVDYEVFDRFNLRLAYKYDDVKQTIHNKEVERQLTPKNRGLINVAYALPFERTKFDITGQFTGEQRLPSTSETQNGFETAYYSPTFWRLNSQISHQLKDFEVYVGGENLLNYTQDNPIIGAENPFGNNFDASSVWGPIIGRNVYIGFRFEPNLVKSD